MLLLNMALVKFLKQYAVFNQLVKVGCLSSNLNRQHQQNFFRYCSTISSPFPEFLEKENISHYTDLHKFSVENSDEFWSTLARSRLSWSKDFTEVSDVDLSKGHFRWFADGQLNVSVNCVDRHYKANPDALALIWEKDEPGQEERVTYRDLYQLVCRLANTMKAHGVKKGDRVAIYMPNSPVAVATMLACTRIGAIHSVVFAGFSDEALAARINDAAAETVFTSDQALRGGKPIELKRTVDSAVSKCACVKRVFVAARTGAAVPMGELDIRLEPELERQAVECPPEPMGAEEPLFMLYTSGSTGKPKGLLHSQAGYLLYAGVTHRHCFNYSPGDVYACVADIGWITGHSYVVYGPLVNGATTVLFESTPTYPDPGRYWEMVQRLRIKQFYGSPTAVRLLIKYDDSYVTKYDRSSLRTLGCVGEPLNSEAFLWYRDVVGGGHCEVVDTWWQTETGGICLAPRPSASGAEILPAKPMRAFPGVQPCLVATPELGADTLDVLPDSARDVQGALCLQRTPPSMARTIYGDHERYLQTYFSLFKGVYFSGDGAHRDESGYYQIVGRMDDVINVSGHRLGTAEVEDVMDEHQFVAETAVVGFPHSIKGEGVYAFVELKLEASDSEETIVEELRASVKKNIASFAVPDVILIVPGLPKTRSGKIMRRILRKVAANKPDELGDISTLAEPAVVKSIVDAHAAKR